MAREITNPNGLTWQEWLRRAERYGKFASEILFQAWALGEDPKDYTPNNFFSDPIDGA